MESHLTEPGGPSSVDLVTQFLRGQNLEQLGRTDEAIDLYEAAVTAAFDSPGPYDRLIQIYSHRSDHPAVIRIADAALEHVRTHPDKRKWFEAMRTAATESLLKVPSARPRRGP